MTKSNMTDKTKPNNEWETRILKDMFEYCYKLDIKLKLHGDGKTGECQVCGLNPDKLFGEVKKLLQQQRKEIIKEIEGIVPNWIDNPNGEINAYTTGRRDERKEIRERLKQI